MTKINIVYLHQQQQGSYGDMVSIFVSRFRYQAQISHAVFQYHHTPGSSFTAHVSAEVPPRNCGLPRWKCMRKNNQLEESKLPLSDLQSRRVD